MSQHATHQEMLAHRAKLQKMVSMALRAGYGLYAFALTVFFVGFMTGPTPTIVWIIIACLIVGGILLAPALVLKYGLRAALREERAQAR